MNMGIFHTASDGEIKKGETTDIYFTRTGEILKAKGLTGLGAMAEFTVGELPRNWPWGVFCGVEEVARLFEGYPVNVYSLPEGSIFRSTDGGGVRAPVMVVEGSYSDYCLLETPALGLLCKASGIATMAARIRKMVGDRLLISFGIRRMHPAISPMIDRAAYLGGFDGVSCVASARALGKRAMGTMPHSLIIAMGDQREAWKAFDEVMGPEVARIALVDTYYDEKTETIMAVETLGKRLQGVRLDTPSSRRGDLPTIIREVKWELGLRGRGDVKVIVSGGLDDTNIPPLVEAGADGFGVGTSISDAPVIDFAMDIVEIEGRPVAKRGKLGGRKELWRCKNCLTDTVTPAHAPTPRCPRCGGETEGLLKPLIKNGKLVGKLPKVDAIRRFVLSQLEKLPEITPKEP